jgi:hypothetical protein
MKKLATTILKDKSSYYYELISKMSASELIKYNDVNFKLSPKLIDGSLNTAMEINKAVKDEKLKFIVESRRGYKLLTYYV